MATFFWYCGPTDEAVLIDAVDEDEAFRKVLARRLQFDDLETACRNFQENDHLFEIPSKRLEIEPYQGELPAEEPEED